MSQEFSKGKIYKITNDYNDDIYVGSTCDTLVKRFSRHRKDCKKRNHLPLYELIEKIGFERFRIELIENYPCEDKYQLRQKEGLWIRQLGTLNIKIEGRTRKEYNDEHKEQRKERYENNKDIILEKQKEYRGNNREVILEKQKEYRENEDNKDKIKNIQHKWYLENKNSFSEKVKCECGCEVNRSSLLNHKKTKKHLDLISNN